MNTPQAGTEFKEPEPLSFLEKERQKENQQRPPIRSMKPPFRHAVVKDDNGDRVLGHFDRDNPRANPLTVFGYEHNMLGKNPHAYQIDWTNNESFADSDDEEAGNERIGPSLKYLPGTFDFPHPDEILKKFVSAPQLVSDNGLIGPAQRFNYYKKKGDFMDNFKIYEKLYHQNKRDFETYHGHLGEAAWDIAHSNPNYLETPDHRKAADIIRQASFYANDLHEGSIHGKLANQKMTVYMGPNEKVLFNPYRFVNGYDGRVPTNRPGYNEKEMFNPEFFMTQERRDFENTGL